LAKEKNLIHIRNPALFTKQVSLDLKTFPLLLASGTWRETELHFYSSQCCSRCRGLYRCRRGSRRPALHTRARTAACRSVSSTAACHSMGHAHTRTDWTIGHALQLDHRWSAGRRKTPMRRGCQRAYMRAQGRYLAICQKMPSQMQNCWRQVFFIFTKKTKDAKLV